MSILNVTFFCDTDVGQVRFNNEDNLIAQYLWDGQHLLCAVIDGVGGYEGGEVAAEMARDTIIRYLEDFPKGKCLEQLKLAVIDANNEIMRYKAFSPRYAQMGCVLTVALIELDNMVINVVHIGDTRLYQYHNGSYKKLTHDHSFVGFLEEEGKLTEEEAMRHPHRNIIDCYLGETNHQFEDEDFVETAIFPILPNSQLLFCSDGLYDMVTSAETCQILKQSIPPEEKVQMLIDKANENGGKDNITAIVLDFNSAIQKED